MFPCGEELAAAGPVAEYRSVAIAARAAADGSAASGGMSDRFVAHAVADRAAVRGNGSTIGQNDCLDPAAGMAVGRHSEVVAAAPADNCAAVRIDNSVAVEDSCAADAIRSSAVAVLDNYAGAQSNCAPAGTGIAAGIQAGSVFAVAGGIAAGVLDGSAANAGAPGVRGAAQGHCDDFARGTGPLLTPAT
jgi:hypothetical protein